jgi:hypothetical protein
MDRCSSPGRGKIFFPSRRPDRFWGPSSLLTNGGREEESKAIPVTGRGGPYGCETLRLPHFLDNRLTDGGEVSLTRRPLFTPRNFPGTHFC